MLGIAGLDVLGAFHALTGVVALAAGLLVFAGRKGTRAHRRRGWVYAVAMLLLNATGLLIYDLYGRFGPFHVAALVSLATLIVGVAAARARWPSGGRWVEVHAIVMGWSYIGLIAAFMSEIATRVPGVPFDATWIAVTVVVCIIGAVLVHTRAPRIAAALAGRRGPAQGGGVS